MSANPNSWPDQLIELSESIMTNCIFCEKALSQEPHVSGALNTKYYYNCDLCGLVQITDEVYLETYSIKKDLHKISGLLREWNYRKIKYTTIKSTELKDLLARPEIPRTNLDKVDKLVLYFGRVSETFGHSIILDNQRDYTLTYSPNSDEFQNILNYLKTQNWLDKRPVNQPGGGNGLALSMEGWKRFYELEKTVVDTKQCFIAMNFKNEFDPAYQKISEAAEACGFKAYRVKGVQTNDDISDLIISEIKKSRFVIADFSGERPSAYYEAGYAKGLNKEVIWMCKKGDQLHFDTRQFSHILWENEEDLKKQLIDKIGATIK